MRQDERGRVVFDQVCTAAAFAQSLEWHCDWFTTVPDSVFRRVYPALSHWHFAPRENHAVAMAFGARLGGRNPCVLIQNTGLGLCMDALLGTFRLYGQGLLLVVSNRGVLSWEEMQHQEWGTITEALLSAARIQQISFDAEGLSGLDRAAKIAFKQGEIVALMVQRGNLDE